LNSITRLLLTGLCLLLTACASVEKGHSPAKPKHDSAPDNPPDVSQVPDAVPKAEPKSKYGNMDSYEVFGKRYYTKDSSHGYVAHGKASWYGTKFHGQRTSSGEPYDMYEMTAAHTTLPLPTYVRVTNTANGKNVIVKVNDRGPFHGDRIIDLSYAAAARIGILQQGVGHVKVEAINHETHHKPLVMAENKVKIPEYAPTQAPAPAPAPATKTAPPQQKVNTQNNDPKWYLQLAAFGEKTYAENLMDELEGIIEQPMQINQNGKDAFYRVQIGPFNDERSAQAYQKQLAGIVIENPILVTQ
jgi:rare lipoprotein A